MLNATNPIQDRAEEEQPILRAIRTQITERQVVAIEIEKPVLLKGRQLQPGEQAIIIFPRRLPDGFILGEDAAILLQEGAAKGITQSELQQQDNEL